MQNQKPYRQFQDEQEYPRGIPMGQPVQQPAYEQASQSPYFQNMQQQQYEMQNLPYSQPVHQNNVFQPHSSKVYNNSIPVKCQCCRQNVNTIVNLETGNTTIMWSVAICCVVGQCCCIPFLFDDCLDKTHYCPNCGNSIIRKHAKCLDFING